MTAMTRQFVMIFRTITELIITGFTSLNSLVSMTKLFKILPSLIRATGRSSKTC